MFYDNIRFYKNYMTSQTLWSFLFYFHLVPLTDEFNFQIRITSKFVIYQLRINCNEIKVEWTNNNK